MQLLIARSAAPQLTHEDIANYREFAKSAPADVAAAILELANMAKVFLETEESPDDHLSPEEIKRIDHVVPYEHECKGMQGLFDALPNGPKDSPAWNLRKACFHLLFYAVCLSKDLEPLTVARLNRGVK